MSRQDKATTERHTRTLRDLVKRPENKVCADCKRNDPRWASWNLGVFLCIRCSGIHRGMGTHISKVKSVDLDVWTPEQMESIQKWGNQRANLYWEAHLKAGHIPPDHKMESFIRSKYESRRWAKDGPPPEDPSTLESSTTRSAASAAAAEPLLQQPSSPPPRAMQTQTHAPSGSISNRNAAPVTSRQPQAQHRLISSTLVGQSPSAPTTTTSAPAPAAAAAPAVDNGLFSLDFHSPSTTPAPSSSPPPKKDAKQDIMSLFSSPAAQPNVAASVVGGAGFGQFSGAMPAMSQAGAWGNAVNPGVQATAMNPTSMMGNSGTGMWGVNSGWNGTGAGAVPPAQANVWGGVAQQQQQQPNLFASGNDIWGNSSSGMGAMGSGGSQDLFGSFASSGAGTTSPAAQKKDDAFGDIWGGFK
ncbi:hypothetical protein D9758_007291 [Tetrapyrgos nigripes]|uniref:Arf-GAP domain-containing protein n=1 Tax=Tetrapyrgos nigripes TaxID=182062 RepID=A0A8H5LL96_9AGAR|nr:hypothetical protein D9758_007291 [Tetrapyrgos nigripes]